MSANDTDPITSFAYFYQPEQNENKCIHAKAIGCTSRCPSRAAHISTLVLTSHAYTQRVHPSILAVYCLHWMSRERARRSRFREFAVFGTSTKNASADCVCFAVVLLGDRGARFEHASARSGLGDGNSAWTTEEATEGNAGSDRRGRKKAGRERKRGSVESEGDRRSEGIRAIEYNQRMCEMKWLVWPEFLSKIDCIQSAFEIRCARDCINLSKEKSRHPHSMFDVVYFGQRLEIVSHRIS